MARNTTRRGRAIYGGKSTMTEDLKDINQDDRRDFGDTWLGDLLGADGKAGVQGPGLRESRRGARRGSDQAPTSSARPQSRPQAERRVGDTVATGGVSTPEVEVRNISPVNVGRGDGMAEARRRRDDALIANAEAAIRRAEETPTVLGYTWEQVQGMPNAMTRIRSGLPAYPTYSEFLELARQERASRATPAPAAPEPTVANGMRTALRQVAGTTGLGRVLDVAERAGTAMSESAGSTTGSRGRNRSRTGYAKGGLVEKPTAKRKKATKTTKTTGKSRSGHSDMRKGGLFK